jgi:hypothetical protein
VGFGITDACRMQSLAASSIRRGANSKAHAECTAATSEDRARKFGREGPTLDRDYPVPCDSNHQGSLDELHGNNQALVTVLGDENSLEPIETAPLDSNLPSDAQERVRRERNLAIKNCSNSLNLTIGDGNSSSPDAHEVYDAVSAQDENAAVRCAADSDEDVPWKQGHLHQAAAITPLVQGREQRKKRGNTLLPQIFGDFLFVPRPSLNREP